MVKPHHSSQNNHTTHIYMSTTTNELTNLSANS
jgi:hypothetical protein